jgi:hypothetical protein
VDANASAWEILVSDLLSSKQRVNRWSPRSRHGVHLVLANPYAGEREEWYPNDCHSLIDARDHDEIVGGLRAEIERLTELLDRKSSVAYEDAQDRVAAETTTPHVLAEARGTDDPKLTLLGLPKEWNAACEHALKCVPDGLSDEHPRVAERYMDIRNAYIAGAQGSDFGVPRSSAVKTGCFEKSSAPPDSSHTQEPASSTDSSGGADPFSDLPVEQS